MKENKTKPDIRFKGFTEAWEQRKLGNIGVAKSGIGFPDAEQGGTEGIPFYKVSDMNTKGNEHELVIAKNYVTQEQIAKKKWNVIEDVPAIFFAKVGAAVMLNRKRLVRFPFLLDNNTMAYIFDKNVWDYNFGKTLFETIDLTKLTQVGALPSYNASDVEGVKISIPNKQEQEQIGGYFSSLDNLITLHQRECDQLKELKKSMLKKMFPRDESSIPEVRFAGFTDAWEQRKLIDLCDYVDYRGKTPNKSDSGIFLVTAKNVKDGYIDYDVSKEYIPEDKYEEVMRRGKPKIGDVLITTEAPCGNVAQVNKPNIALAQRIIKYRGHNQVIDNTYLKYYLLSPFFQNILNMKSSGGTVQGIKGSVLHQQKISFTKYTEQLKIGQCLDSLDSLITLHQRELEILKNLKKTCLKRMFI